MLNDHNPKSSRLELTFKRAPKPFLSAILTYKNPKPPPLQQFLNQKCLCVQSLSFSVWKLAIQRLAALTDQGLNGIPDTGGVSGVRWWWWWGSKHHC